ncbi:MAG: hypothetical protein RL532_577 [Actinomycetota bacterium]
MLQQQLATLAAAGVVKRVYVGGEPRPEISEARHLADMYPGEGPFGAIVTTLAEALRLSNDAQATDVIVALAVDVPLVTPSTINRLIAELVTNDAGTTNEEALTNEEAARPHTTHYILHSLKANVRYIARSLRCVCHEWPAVKPSC